jgi:acyl-CoA thioester hydrolase
MVKGNVPAGNRAVIGVDVRVDIRVIYGDTDQMGVVYYANYLRYFEAGRNEYLRACGLRYRDFETQHRIFLPVVEAQVGYKAPARYDDLLAVYTGISRLGRASARFEYRVVRDETVLATGHTVHACVNAAGAVRPLPVEVRDLLGAADTSPSQTPPPVRAK